MKRRGYYRGIPIYFSEYENEIWGRNGFYDALLSVMLWIDIEIFEEEDFPIWLEDKEG